MRRKGWGRRRKEQKSGRSRETRCFRCLDLGIFMQGLVKFGFAIPYSLRKLAKSTHITTPAQNPSGLPDAVEAAEKRLFSILVMARNAVCTQSQIEFSRGQIEWMRAQERQALKRHARGKGSLNSNLSSYIPDMRDVTRMLFIQEMGENCKYGQLCKVR